MWRVKAPYEAGMALVPSRRASAARQGEQLESFTHTGAPDVELAARSRRGSLSWF
jgi:hypothetical protein